MCSKSWFRSSIIFLTFLASTLSALAQSTSSPSPSPSPSGGFVRKVAKDQKAIWLSPLHIKRDDLKYLVPLAAATGVLIATDRKTSGWVDRYGSLPPVSHDVSFGGSAYAEVGTTAGMYFFGRATGHPYLARTGALATEALLDATILTEVLKVSAQRMRPDDGTGDGSFFHHGSSFPSGHSSSSWAVATVIAYRYKQHPFIKYGAFAAAAAISMSRYSGRNHFPSDILIGGAIGYGIGRFVYGHR